MYSLYIHRFLWILLAGIILDYIVGKAYRGCLVVNDFPSSLYYCHYCFLAHLLYLADSRCKLFGGSIGPLFYAKDDVFSRLLLIFASLIHTEVTAKTKSLRRNIAPASQVAINKKFAHDTLVVF